MTIKIKSYHKPKYIYFGGAFDPFHQAHLEIIRFVAECFHDSKFYIAPCYKSQTKKFITCFDHRCKLIGLSLGDNNYKIDLNKSVEISKVTREYYYHLVNSNKYETKSFRSFDTRTYEIVCYLKKKYNLQDLEIAWVIGQDQLHNFDNWYLWQKLIKKIVLIVIPRTSGSLAKNSDSIDKKSLTDFDDKVSDNSGDSFVFQIDFLKMINSVACLANKYNDNNHHDNLLELTDVKNYAKYTNNYDNKVHGQIDTNPHGTNQFVYYYNSPFKVYFMQNKVSNISSSMIKDFFIEYYGNHDINKQYEKKLINLLGKAAFDYIVDNNLYSDKNK